MEKIYICVAKEAVDKTCVYTYKKNTIPTLRALCSRIVQKSEALETDLPLIQSILKEECPSDIQSCLLVEKYRNNYYFSYWDKFNSQDCIKQPSLDVDQDDAPDYFDYYFWRWAQIGFGERFLLALTPSGTLCEDFIFFRALLE